MIKHFWVQGRCKPSAIELVRIAEAPPVLANLFAKLRCNVNHSKFLGYSACFCDECHFYFVILDKITNLL